MNDMVMAIQPKSDQINADDLIGGDMTITITGVKIDASAEQKVAIQFAGSAKVFRPCKSMARVMVAAWGADANVYVGRSMSLYRDPKVKWGGMEVGGIRIRAMSHLASDLNLMLTMTKQSRAPYRVAKMDAAPAVLTADRAMQIATAAAEKGTANFRAWFNTDEGKDCRAAAKIAVGGEALATLQRVATEADQRAQGDVDPMSTDPELHSTITATRAARDAMQSLADTITERLAAGESASDLRLMFAEQIMPMEAAAPDLFAQVMGVLG